MLRTFRPSSPLSAPDPPHVLCAIRAPGEPAVKIEDRRSPRRIQRPVQLSRLALRSLIEKNGSASLRMVIATAILIQAAQGVFDVSLALRAERAGLSATEFGWTGAAHSAGFVIGAFLAPLALACLGGYGLLFCACLIATPLAALGWSSSWAAWLLTRLAAGFAFALLFAATDTAVIDTAPADRRSRAIGVYVMFERLAMMAMPFTFAGCLSARPTLAYGVACLWMCLIPARTLRHSHPPQGRSGPRSWSTALAAWQLAPVAVLCAFGAGALNSSLLVLLPRWVHGTLGEAAVPIVQAAAWSGALSVQLTAGFLAPERARSRLGLWLSPAAALAVIALPFAANHGLLATVLASATIGMCAFSQYGLALMAMAETRARSDRAPPTPALVFAWGLGAVIGPAACSATGLYAVPPRLFAVIAAFWLAVPAICFVAQRSAARTPGRAAGT